MPEGASLLDDLWWFIENHSGLSSERRNEMFFRLRERVREYQRLRLLPAKQREKRRA